MTIKSTDYLRELATRLRKVPVCHGVDGYDIDSLRELSMGIAELEKANVAYVDANTVLIRENAKLREALTFYSKRENWIAVETKGLIEAGPFKGHYQTLDNSSPAEADGGNRARAVLGEKAE